MNETLSVVRYNKGDGFRFDLMGLHDVNTMNEIRNALDRVNKNIAKKKKKKKKKGSEREKLIRFLNIHANT